MKRVELVVYSDYLCPWCHSASYRLHQIRKEFGDQLELTWRAFLLRPQASPKRDLEKFRRYTQSWSRPASEDDSPEFRVWETDLGPPSHSVPAHVVAKAAARLGNDQFERMHERLLRAYFVENRDISDENTLRAIWEEAGLQSEAFARPDDPEFAAEVLKEHEDALHLGVTGVPAVRMAEDDVVITGAHPRELYQRWIRKRL